MDGRRVEGRSAGVKSLKHTIKQATQTRETLDERSFCGQTPRVVAVLPDLVQQAVLLGERKL